SVRPRAAARLHGLCRSPRSRQGRVLLGDGGARRAIQARDRGRQAAVAFPRRRGETPDLRSRQNPPTPTRPVGRATSPPHSLGRSAAQPPGGRFVTWHFTSPLAGEVGGAAAGWV